MRSDIWQRSSIVKDRYRLKHSHEIIDRTQMEAKSIITQPSNSLAAHQRGSENISVLSTACSIANLIVLVTFAVAIYAGIPKQKRRSTTAKQLPGMMCRRCEYFNDNHYIKCALHPTTVMTEGANNCQDCQLKLEAEWVKKMKNILPSIYNFFTK
jgi:hypothetical protein